MLWTDDFLVEKSSNKSDNEKTIVVLLVFSFHQLKLDNKQNLGVQLEQNKSYVVKSCEVSKLSGGAGNTKSCNKIWLQQCTICSGKYTVVVCSSLFSKFKFSFIENLVKWLKELIDWAVFGLFKWVTR